MTLVCIYKLTDLEKLNIYSTHHNIPNQKRMPQKTEYDPFLHYADHEPPIDILELKQDLVDQLSMKEEQYAHYMSKASQAGTRIVLRQVSHESEGLFDMIMDNHKHVMAHCGGQYPKGSHEHERRYYLEYCSQFLNNLGNYTFFGDSKFIPQCSREYWYELLRMRGVHTSDKIQVNSVSPIVSLVDKLTYKDLIETVFFINEANVKLGFPNENNHSSYYFGNVSNDDMHFLTEKVYTKYGILPDNTRVWKEEGTVLKEETLLEENDQKKKCTIKIIHFRILIASVFLKNKTELTGYPQGKFTVEKSEAGDILGDETRITAEFIFGDHSNELARIVSYLRKAIPHVSNALQLAMLQDYIKYFETGDGEYHKDSQRKWVKDSCPMVECNCGFIESYRDPSGVLGEFQSIVALQNKKRTKSFQDLVQHASEFIATLPWSKEFENDSFKAPDFTALEVLTFTGSGIPVGINIPNYSDIKEEIGCKNIAMSNVLDLDSKIKTKPSFILENQIQEFKKYSGEAFNIQVGLHELIGHGTGKLLSEIETSNNGKESGKEFGKENSKSYNFDIDNPPLGLDGKPVSTHYSLNETWFNKFGPISGAYEECRAECIGMYLLPNKKILECFGISDKIEQEKVIFNGYLLMARSGLNALQYWSPETNQIMQPHMAARFIVFKQFLKDKNFCKIVLNENETDFFIELNANLIESVGVKLVGDLLQHLHVYRCSGDVERGTEYYNKAAQVPEELLKLRPIVLSKKLPRKQIIQTNTFLGAPMEKNGKTPMEKNGKTLSNNSEKTFIDNTKNKETPKDNIKDSIKTTSNKISKPKNKITKGKKIYIKHYPETALGMLDSFAEREY